MIGRLIDGRYQVRSRIARGGMATVYLASDLRLERPVAIKIMHGHLADDEQFKERFIQEARSAARLAHPNVVNVFDQGQDSESAYLVMEYLPGITLRELLQEHRVLTAAQATDILEAVLAGLAAAHRAGIVHRDLKPENVLLADDGRIKIGDFGLARAASANTATGAALLGTIAYLSPELVTRGIADTRSDIYALGIMLYEMLTGEQPYKGDQPMQIAYQHANDTVPTPSTANPSVPPELDELVLWATARDPDQRPRDARAMLEQLFELQRSMADPSATGLQRTLILPAAGVRPGSGGTGDTTLLPRARHRTGPVGAAADAPAPPTNAEALARKSGRRHRRGLVWLAIVVVLALLAGGVGWYFNLGPGAQVAIPTISNVSVPSATSTLESRGFGVASRHVEVFDATIASGSVTGTRPGSGTTVHKGSIVSLLVSKGPKMLDVPVVIGTQEAAARTALAGFTIKDSAYQFDDQAKGIVLGIVGQNASGGPVDLSTATTYGDKQPVTLTVSLGPVPDVDGQSYADAQTALTAVKLVGTEVDTEYSDTVASGLVLSSKPAVAGVVHEGDTIDLVVSKGQAPITVPDVTTKSLNSATSTLQALGLKVSYANCSSLYCTLFDWKNALSVTSTSPAAGAIAHRGDTITLTYPQG